MRPWMNVTSQIVKAVSNRLWPEASLLSKLRSENRGPEQRRPCCVTHVHPAFPLAVCALVHTSPIIIIKLACQQSQKCPLLSHWKSYLMTSSDLLSSDAGQNIDSHKELYLAPWLMSRSCARHVSTDSLARICSNRVLYSRVAHARGSR